jgi:hypothetical protein
MSEDRSKSAILVVSILLMLVGAGIASLGRIIWNTAMLGIAFFFVGVGLFLGAVATR